MLIAVILLSLALAVIAFYALRYALSRFLLSFKQEAEMKYLAGRNMGLEIREEITQRFMHDIKLSHVAHGQAEGYKEIARAMPGIYGRHLDAMVSQMERNTKKLIEGELAKHRLALGHADVNQLKDQLDLARSNNKTLRENQEELTKQRDRWKQRYDVLKDQPAPNPIQTHLEVYENPQQSRSEPGSNLSYKPSEPGSDSVLPSGSTGLPGKVRAMSPEYHYDDSHRDYYFDFQETQEGLRVQLKRKQDDQILGWFYERHLQAGQPMKKGSKYVVLCGLSSCSNVKISQQPTTRCCCREHASMLRKIEAENDQLAEGMG